MGLNAIIKHMEETQPDTRQTLTDKEREYAERIFFEKELKDCNFGMSELKFRDRVKHAISRAQVLYREIYGL